MDYSHPQNSHRKAPTRGYPNHPLEGAGLPGKKQEEQEEQSPGSSTHRLRPDREAQRDGGAVCAAWGHWGFMGCEQLDCRPGLGVWAAT